MLSTLIRRREEEGFTLVELMVVILIIAILIGAAIPTFLGLRSRAQDSAAKQDLRNTLTAAKAEAVDHDGLYVADADNDGTNDIADRLGDIEPALTFVDIIGSADADEAEVGTVYVVEADGAEFAAARVSASGNVFLATDNNTDGGGVEDEPAIEKDEGTPTFADLAGLVNPAG